MNVTPARLGYLCGLAYADGRRDCRSAGGDPKARIARRIDLPNVTGPAYDPWRSRAYPVHADALTAAYETGWGDGLRDLQAPDPGWA